MLRNRNRRRRRLGGSRVVGYQPRIESLEERTLLAVGPFLYVHNTNRLAVVDAASGELDIINRMTGFQDEDRSMNDVAFSPDGRLLGVANQWLYEIHPVTGVLTPMGIHGIEDITSLVFTTNGSLQAMGRNSADLFQMTIDDTSLIGTTRLATLSDFDGSVIGGSNGDITYYQGDLLVATTDDRLIRYRFDIGPSRPRFLQEIDLSALDVTDVFGLATVNNNRLYATAGTSVYELDISDPNAPSATEVSLVDSGFGAMRGAAYYNEAGGPIPVGTISGIKWFDRNKDGLRQNNEPTLSDWPVYVDENLNGSFDVGEPLRRTDDTGRYYFFGQEPGLYTVDEIIADPTRWEQTYPTTPDRNLVGTYGFSNGRTENQLSHEYGLPDLTNSFVSLTADGADFIRVGSSLELPWALGDSPFTIVFDATYSTVFGTEQYLVSQLGGPDGAERDFQMAANPTTRSVTTSFCNGQGDCAGPELGVVDDSLHRYAITWNGEAVGSFFDGQLVTQTITGTLPDIDSEVVRFGNPSSLDSPAGMRGVVRHIRIFNRALTEEELVNAFETATEPNAYSILLDDVRGINDLNFGNAEPTVVVMAPEIQVNRDAADGDQVISGGTIDLGISSSSDVAPQAEVFISNVGTKPLEITDLIVTIGFQLQGIPDSPLDPGESTSFRVVVVDLTQGFKGGVIGIENNDEDENPFLIELTAEIFDPDDRPRQILINTTTGNLLQVDPIAGRLQTIVTGSPPLTDIAFDPRNDRLYGIDSTFMYEIDLAANDVRTLFPHNVPSATALGFAPNGQLFAAGADVYQIDLESSTTEKIADGGVAVAGDIAFLGNRMLMSTTNGDLYEVQSNKSTRLGNLNGIGMKGLVATGTDTLYGFADNQGYLINVDALSVTPQFGLFVFTVAGSTYLPVVDAHNEEEPLDVDGDGRIVPFDALLVINELNSPTFTDPVTGRIVGAPQGETRYPDANGDGFVTAIDALLIINYLNEPPAAIATLAVAEALVIDPLAADTSLTIEGGLLDDLLVEIALSKRKA